MVTTPHRLIAISCTLGLNTRERAAPHQRLSGFSSSSRDAIPQVRTSELIGSTASGCNRPSVRIAAIRERSGGGAKRTDPVSRAVFGGSPNRAAMAVARGRVLLP